MNSERELKFTHFSVKQPLTSETCKNVLCSGKLDVFLFILQQHANLHTEQGQMFTLQHETKLPRKRKEEKDT